MKKIEGQVIYCGPMIPALGLQYGAIFRNGIHDHLYVAIAECPAIGELFVRVKDYAIARRELNFDIARNMLGTSGKYVTFYRQIEIWLAAKTAGVRTVATSTGVKSHAK